MSHQLAFSHRVNALSQKVAEAACGQEFVGQSAVTLVWACVPYRGEWRYTIRSAKTMLLDAGHIAQNLYLAAESLGLGTCTVAAYDQEAFDQLLQLDGQDEFTVYLASVGRPL